MHGAGRLTPAQRAKAWLCVGVNHLLEAIAAKREMRHIGLTRSEILRVASEHVTRF
jgi:hypothetical protein